MTEYMYTTGTDVQALLINTLQGWRVHTWHIIATPQKQWGGVEDATIRHHVMWEREGDEGSNGSTES